MVDDVRTAALTPPEPQDPRVVIVAVTEHTLAQFPYRSPVDRAFLAKLLQTLEARGARVIGLDVLYGVDIVIGEKTAAEVPAFALLELDLIRVKGKTRPVHIYALVGDELAAVDPAFSALSVTHDAMLAAYRARNWPEARRHLEAARAQAPELMRKFYRVYETRIAAFEAEPPPADWDGVYVALMK